MREFKKTLNAFEILTFLKKRDCVYFKDLGDTFFIEKSKTVLFEAKKRLVELQADVYKSRENGWNCDQEEEKLYFLERDLKELIQEGLKNKIFLRRRGQLFGRETDAQDLQAVLDECDSGNNCITSTNFKNTKAIKRVIRRHERRVNKKN